MTGRMEWYVQFNIARFAYDFVAFHRRDNGRGIVRAELTVTDHEPGTFVAEPTLSIGEDEAQQIMNGLWNAGLRPKNGAGAVAHTESLQAHLSDLRTIAFHALKIK